MSAHHNIDAPGYDHWPWAMGFVATLLSLGALNYYLLFPAKDKVIAVETVRQEHVAHLLEGSVDAVLNQAEGVLLEVRDNLRNTAFKPQFDAYLKAESANNEVLQAIVVRDDDGTPIKTSDPELTEIADGAPAFFATHTDRKNLLYISPPMRSSVDGTWRIWLSVPGEGTGAGSDSMISAAIDSRFIAEHLMPVEGTESDANTLVDRNLLLVSRMPWPHDRIGESLAGYPLYELLKSSGKNRAVTRYISTFSGTDRLGVAHWIFGHRFMISSSRRMDAILAGWKQLVWTAGLASLAILCLFVGLWWRAARDAAQKNKAAEALRESEREFRLLVSGVTDHAMFMLTPEGRVANWNAGAERIKGYSADEIVGEHIERFYTKKDRDKGLPAKVLEQAAKLGRYELEGWRLRKDGTLFWANVVVEALRENGELVGFAKMTRDVTERRKMLKTLRAAKVQAEHAAQVKSDFLANMSHEIRTPLTGIIGYSGIALDDQELTGNPRRYVGRVYEASKALRVIIDDILDFSKIEAGELRIEPARFCLIDHIDSCLSIVRPTAIAKDLDLKSSIAPHVPPWLVGDGPRLRQILLNFLNNAIKFTIKGEIELKVECEARSERQVTLRFSVRDTGIGIAEDQQSNIFDRFTQGDTSITRRFGGTGLGLAISKRLVDAMKGRSGIESELGVGSTFWFSIPFKIAERPEEQAPQPKPSAGGSLRVLMADDLDLNRDVVKLTLEPMGHELTLAASGAQAVALAAEHPFDLILMDIQMPGLDGIEATRLIRASAGPNAETPIVALTANVMADQVVRYKKIGMNEFFGKPIDVAQLKTFVQGWALRLGKIEPSEPRKSA